MNHLLNWRMYRRILLIVLSFMLISFISSCDSENDNKDTNNEKNVSSSITANAVETATVKAFTEENSLSNTTSTYAKTVVDENITKAETSKKVAKKPKIVIPEPSYIICSLNEEPSIILKSQNKNDRIFYTLDGEMPTSKSFKYTKPIQISRFNENGVLLGFTLKAISTKEGFSDSKVLEQKFKFESTYDSGGDCIVCDKSVEIGDTIISGTISENKITKQMRKNVVLSVTRDKKTTEYKAKVDNGKFVINIDKALEAGDELSLTSEFDDKVVHFYKENNIIHIWEEYFVFYCGGLVEKL